MGFQASLPSSDTKAPTQGVAQTAEQISSVKGIGVPVCHRCGELTDVEESRCPNCEFSLPEVARFEARFLKRKKKYLVEVHWEVAGSEEIYLGNEFRDLDTSGSLLLETGDEVMVSLELLAYNEYGYTRAQLTIAREKPVIQEFQASESAISLAYPTIFSWRVAHAERIEIDGGVGEVTGRSFVQHQLSKPGEYTLKAYNSAGVVEAKVELSLPLPEIHSFFTSRDHIQLGNGNTLFWDVANASELRLDPIGEDVLDKTRFEVTPDRTTIYSLVASNASGEVRKELTLTLPAPVIDYFEGDPVSTEGRKIFLEWEVRNAHTVILEPGIGEVPAAGEIRLKPPQAYTTYRLTAKGHSGTTSAEFTVVRFPIPLEMESVDQQFNKMLKMSSNVTDPKDNKTAPLAREKSADTGSAKAVEKQSGDISSNPAIRRVQEMDLEPNLVSLERTKARQEFINGLRKLKRIIFTKIKK